MKKLIKIDIIHPREWLRAKQAGLPELDRMPLAEYRDWLNGLASNYSDFYTHYLTESGAWRAEEYYLLDPVFEQKVAEHLWGKWRARIYHRAVRVGERILRRPQRWRQIVLRAYLREFGPDVIFVRSQPLPSAFWQPYRDRAYLVARLSARLPRGWHPNDFDLIYTDQPDFKHFFELHGTETIMNKQGFDPRIIARLTDRPNDSVVFVGGLGVQNFLARTEFFARIAAETQFDWYGYWWEESPDGRTLADFPALERAHRGPTSGLEMYQIYHDAAICLNDYVDTANGNGFNQRMFEVMGAGGFLLTRAAPNFARDFPPGIFATYTDEADCRSKIEYYLSRPGERAAIARRGQEYVLQHYGYPEIAADFSRDLLDRLPAQTG